MRSGHCNWKVFFAKYRKVIKTQYYLFNGYDRNGRYLQIVKIPIEIQRCATNQTSINICWRLKKKTNLSQPGARAESGERLSEVLAGRPLIRRHNLSGTGTTPQPAPLSRRRCRSSKRGCELEVPGVKAAASRPHPGTNSDRTPGPARPSWAGAE